MLASGWSHCPENGHGRPDTPNPWTSVRASRRLPQSETGVDAAAANHSKPGRGRPCRIDKKGGSAPLVGTTPCKARVKPIEANMLPAPSNSNALKVLEHFRFHMNRCISVRGFGQKMQKLSLNGTLRLVFCVFIRYKISTDGQEDRDFRAHADGRTGTIMFH